jgi:hypothetical protein
MLILKPLFLCTTGYILYLIWTSKGYERIHDEFPHVYLLPISVVMTLFASQDYSVIELCWTFSLCLE